MKDPALSPAARVWVLIALFLGLLFDGFELGLMPVASLSVSKSLLGDDFTAQVGGDWFARFTAALMLGAALGGIFLGALGDRIGRSRAMSVSVLLYSFFASAGAFARNQEEMLASRFLVGLGVGGMWPNGMALVSECWKGASKPLVSGVMMAGLNAGILLLSQMARVWPVTSESWRWIFLLAGFPAALGLSCWFFLPESPEWLRGGNRNCSPRTTRLLADLFSSTMLRRTLAGIILSAIPMVGAWAASKWMIPWADEAARSTNPGYKAAVQGWWSGGAIAGSILGAQLAGWLGKKGSYLLISLGAWIATLSMFQVAAPLEPLFIPIVIIQGIFSTLFFGWLALFLPDLFPTGIRSAGSGMSYNTGRFATAFGVLGAGALFNWLGGSYPRVGSVMAFIYALGVAAIWLVPSRNLNEEEAIG